VPERFVTRAAFTSKIAAVERNELASWPLLSLSLSLSLSSSFFVFRFSFSFSSVKLLPLQMIAFAPAECEIMARYDRGGEGKILFLTFIRPSWLVI
jgi:hypothetical protein